MDKKGKIIIISTIIILVAIISMYIYIPKFAKADGNFTLSISCPSTSSAGSTINCTVSATPVGVTLNGINANYSFSEGVALSSFKATSDFANYADGNTAGFVLGKASGFSNTITLGTLAVTLPSNATANQTYSIGLTNIGASDISYNDYSTSDVSASVRILSNENRLSNLSISGASISFNRDITNYSVTINNSSATISATQLDSNAVISGSVGNVSLNYGTNTFYINVKSELGVTKTYTIVVNRPDNRSKNNNLSSLKVSNISFTFNKNTTVYNLTTKESSVNISATAEDSKSTITGTGKKNLSVGLNTYNITVKAENESSKTYVVSITRQENSNTNNNLSSIIATNTNLSFDKNTTTYNLTTSSSSTTISATRESTTSTISGDTGKKNLNVGLNTFVIKVTAQNGSTKVYTLNITRESSKSTNNYLKSLELSTGTINFKKGTSTYNVDVPKDVSSIVVKAELEDSSASYVDNYSPKTVNLNLGNNTIYIKIQSESGSVRTYTINVNRDDGRDSDSTLKSITISSGKIDFNKDTLDYKVSVNYNVTAFLVKAEATKETSKVNIEGNNELVVGDNIFKINVEAENGKITTYTITVKRKEEGKDVSTNNNIKLLTIKNHSIDFKKNVYKYTIKAKESKLDIGVTLEDVNATYEIKGNKNLKDGSKIKIIVTSESGDDKTYTIEIKKSSNILLFIIPIVLVLVVGGTFAYFFIKKKKNNKVIPEVVNVNSFSNNVAENDISPEGSAEEVTQSGANSVITPENTEPEPANEALDAAIGSEEVPQSGADSVITPENTEPELVNEALDASISNEEVTQNETESVKTPENETNNN